MNIAQIAHSTDAIDLPDGPQASWADGLRAAVKNGSICRFHVVATVTSGREGAATVRICRIGKFPRAVNGNSTPLFATTGESF